MIGGFRVKCGPAASTYTIATTVANPAARELPLSSVLSTTGIYFCTVMAINRFGEGPGSPEFSFEAGGPPITAPGGGVTAGVVP